MAKKQSGKLLNFVAWITGVIVSLVVGYAMIAGDLTLPAWLAGKLFDGLIAKFAGWIVVATTLVSAVLAILNK